MFLKESKWIYDKRENCNGSCRSTDLGKQYVSNLPATKTQSASLVMRVCWRKVELGETKEYALIWECQEELDVTLSVDDVFMDVVHEYPDITTHLTLFNATIAEGFPQKAEINDIQVDHARSDSKLRLLPGG